MSTESIYEIIFTKPEKVSNWRHKIMGMAASQARFLQLTARKTNVEFEGQQINQQRTMLANQSASYNNQLLGMKVPTPPSTSDYTRTDNSWTLANGTVNTITSMIPVTTDPTGKKYEIKYKYQSVEKDAYQSDSDPISAVRRNETTPGNYTYYIDGTELNMLSESTDVNALANLRELTGNNNEKFYSYKNPINNQVSYYSESELKSNETVWDSNNNNTAAINKYMIGEHTEVKTNAAATVELTFDKGRMVNILFNGKTYSVDVNTTKDDTAYNNAMNQYNYDQTLYEKAMADINAKLDIVQQQDKNLELQLKAVDTEHNAIQTEIEAVQKVIGKNVESSFKTFNA